MSLQSAAGSQPPCHQTTAIRLLADSLYESTRGSTGLTNQAQNELGLLLAVLSATETYTSSLGAECVHFAVLKKRLHSCHVVLLQLQKLLLHPDALGAQSLVSDIRARLSSVIFGITEVNLNMMISSQKIIEHALRCFVNDVSAGNREALVVSDILRDPSKLEEDGVWTQLQGELVATGISSDLLTLNRNFVIPTLRKLADGLLSADKQDTIPMKVPDSTAPEPVLKLERQRSLDDKDWLADEPSGLPFLPLPPKGFSFSDKHSSYSIPEQPYPEKEAIREENFPIPVILDMQDCTDTQKQALPVENFPIPVLTEHPPPQKDDGMNLPIPVKVPISPKPPKLSLDLDAFKVSRNSKKPHRMSRLLWEITSSKAPFIAAIKANHDETVQTLLSKGADANSQKDDGTTALMAAVSYGHEAPTRLLLEYGADLNAQALTGETALSIAATRGFDRIARMLIASGANVNSGKGIGKTALSQAAAYGQDRIVELLLDCGADIDAVNSTGDTALALAALNGNMRVARLLLDRRAKVDLMRYPWQTPLYKAVLSNVVGMVRLLMERGADPFVKGGTRRTETVMAFAGRMQRREILDVFAQYGYYPGGGGPVRYQYF
ncbi:Ankyrin repeat-containing domain [Penicillium camemberti]|uniref:Ankyrin repeat-containing domain n=1 Tax=Penicillium camemberti (strain FM 013) TaxID=1429867 RepID=A0A0G4PT89_PENC3|nr:Ankyrin repeat-containing domain [Penicillium camemberti]